MATDLVRSVLNDLRTPLYRNAIYLMMNTALIAGAGFLFWFLAAQLLTPTQVGQALVLVSVATLLGVFSQLGFGTGLIRFLPGTTNDRNRMINSCLSLATLVAVVLATGMLLSADLWFSEGGEAIRLSALAPLFLLLVPMMAITTIVNNAFVAGRQAAYVLLKSVLYQATRLATPLVLVALLGVLGVLSALLVGHALALGVAFALLLPRVYPGYRPGPALDRTIVGDILHFSLGNYVGEVLAALTQPVLLLLIAGLLGSAEEAAFFGVPWLIATLLFAVPLMTGVSLYAEGSHFEDRLRKDMLRSLRFLLPLLAAGILFLYFAGGWILALFSPAYAAEGTRLLRILTLSAVFVAVNYIFLSVARVKKWIKAIIALMAAIVGGTLALSFWTIPAYGIDGAGYAWMIANAAVAGVILGVFLVRRQVFAILRAVVEGEG